MISSTVTCAWHMVGDFFFASKMSTEKLPESGSPAGRVWNTVAESHDTGCFVLV